MTIKSQLNDDLKTAMRARDQNKINALRLMTAAIKQIEVDERIEVDDQRMLVILDKLAKQRQESIAQFTKAGRDDLVAQEQYELNIIKEYLPSPLSEAEIASLVAQAIAQENASKISDMGKVMAILKPQLQGRADLAHVSAQVKTLLN